MKYLSILGSTGSIGKQTLDVVRQHSQDFCVVGLSTHHNIDLLEEQMKEFSPKIVCVSDETSYKILKERYIGSIKIVGGTDGLKEIATFSESDILLTAVVGAAGIEPTIHAIKAKKNIALANKETLVAGGELIIDLCKIYGVKILPVDSEHSAIFQCLEGQSRENVEKLIITASGGPLRNWPKEKLALATAMDCLQHPTWSMGNKITIDSATLFNKGLEVIEAHWLFGFSFDKIEVIVHPQSIVHSMIGMKDGAILAQLGSPDMREPIQYALTYPKRLPLKMKHLDWTQTMNLEFFPPRYEDFPALQLAFEVGKAGGFKPAVFNAANEIAAYAFLENKIKFLEIYEIVENTLARMPKNINMTLSNLLDIDLWAREEAKALLSK